MALFPRGELEYSNRLSVRATGIVLAVDKDKCCCGNQK